jgi:DNA-binding CsgD family transcriptional regulator
MASFDTLCHRMIDIWVNAESLETPKELYEPVLKDVTIRMAMSVIDATASDPYDWRFYRVKEWGYRSKLLAQMLREFPNAALRDLNRTFIDNHVVPAFSNAIEMKRPIIDIVKTEVLGVRIGYERIIIPQKTASIPKWCVSLKVGRFAIPKHEEIGTDLTDEGIIQLLIEGNTSKEIAAMMNLSPRTVEHRIDKMKTRFGARNLVHLVAKLVATQVDRKQSA